MFGDEILSNSVTLNSATTKGIAGINNLYINLIKLRPSWNDLVLILFKNATKYLRVLNLNEIQFTEKLNDEGYGFLIRVKDTC